MKIKNLTYLLQKIERFSGSSKQAYFEDFGFNIESFLNKTGEKIK